MDIRPLTADDAPAFWDMRLRALKEEPVAFGSSYEESVQTPVEEIVERFRARYNTPENLVLGAFLDGQLVGIMGFVRATHKKMRHKGEIWGMYVAREARGQGVGRALMTECIARLRQLKGLEQVSLAVVTVNEPARRLYRGLGFEVYGVEPRALKLGERYLDEELMVLRLMQ